jgi:hypothetical protein
MEIKLCSVHKGKTCFRITNTTAKTLPGIQALLLSNDFGRWWVQSRISRFRVRNIHNQHSEFRTIKKLFFTNSPCNANERREASGRYCDAECVPVACALFVCVCRKEIEVMISVREREREIDDGSAPGNKHRGDDLWERETMV